MFMHWELVELTETKVKIAGKALTCKVRIEFVEDPIYEIKGDFDFGSEEENAKYLARFESGELTMITIRVKVQSPDSIWEGVDSLGHCHVKTGPEFKSDVMSLITDHRMIGQATDEMVSEIRRAARSISDLKLEGAR